MTSTAVSSESRNMKKKLLTRRVYQPRPLNNWRSWMKLLSQHSSNSSRDFATSVANTVTKVQIVKAIAKTTMTTLLVMIKTEVTGVNAITVR
jgi:hypothetical protein